MRSIPYMKIKYVCFSFFNGNRELILSLEELKNGVIYQVRQN